MDGDSKRGPASVVVLVRRMNGFPYPYLLHPQAISPDTDALLDKIPQRDPVNEKIPQASSDVIAFTANSDESTFGLSDRDRLRQQSLHKEKSARTRAQRFLRGKPRTTG